MPRILIRKALSYMALTAATALTACGNPDVNDPAAKHAVSTALNAERPDRNYVAIPLNKSITTNYDDGKNIVVARKTGDVTGRSDCGLFQVTAVRPITGATTVSAETNIQICANN